MSGNRRKDDIDLLRRAIDGSTDERQAPARRDRRTGAAQIMYRGQPVNGRGGGRTPGAPGGATRGRSGGGGGDLRAQLQELADLHADGLISQTEYDRKRSEILDRM